jgi:hypothetical protein
MELSLDKKHRVDVLEFVSKARDEYDRLLEEAPDIPGISIHAFNEKFPEKENKPDVCNGLSIIICEDPKPRRWFKQRKSMDSIQNLGEINVV